LGHGVGLLNSLACDRAQIIRIPLVCVLQPAQDLLQQVIGAIGRISLHLRQYAQNGRFAAGIGQISHQAHDHQDLRHKWHNQHDREWQTSQLLNHENGFLIKVFCSIEVAASSRLAKQRPNSTSIPSQPQQRFTTVAPSDSYLFPPGD
jgi:hypothetical protein